MVRRESKTDQTKQEDTNFFWLSFVRLGRGRERKELGLLCLYGLFGNCFHDGDQTEFRMKSIILPVFFSISNVIQMVGRSKRHTRS